MLDSSFHSAVPSVGVHWIRICYHSCSSRMDWLPEINWKKIAALKHGEVQGVKSYPQLSVVEENPKWHRGEKAEAT